MTTLADIAASFPRGTDGITKPLAYYRIYERYFAPLARESLDILELGTYQGDSTKIFATYFPKARLLTLDLEVREIDFTGFANVRAVQADQADQAALERVCGEFAPGGFDIVIDDASHIGRHSLRSYEILFSRVKPGGFYVVEDWGTGYWPEWPDGASRRPVQVVDGDAATRIVSHDHGMVGFVKHLVDETAKGVRNPYRSDDRPEPRTIEFLHCHPGLVILKKLA